MAYAVHPTAVFVAVSLAVSLVSNAVFSGVGEVSAALPLPYSPAPPAFAIWGVIYPLLAMYTVAQGTGAEEPRPSALLGVSVLCAAAWVPLFTRNTPTGFWLATGALAACAACAVAAVVSLPARRGARELLFDELPLALYAGWVCTAAALSVGISLRASGVGVPAWSGSVAAGAIAAAAAALRSPILALPALWGFLWAPRSAWNWAGSAALAASSVIAGLLRAHDSHRGLFAD